MWNRADLKARARRSLRRNYWKSVLVGMVLLLLTGGAGVGSSSSNTSAETGEETQVVETPEDGVLLDAQADETGNVLIASEMMVFGMGFFVYLLSIVFFLALYLLFFNPLEVGCDYFFWQNLSEPARVGCLGYAFDVDYLNIVKVMFYRNLKVLLWALLLVVPGIVKAYECQMIPYLLAENSQMSKEEAFAESKRMMDGQKWNAFVLDLSFLGWAILSTLTGGLLSIFYVLPYLHGTHAALFETLRYGNPNQEPDLAQIYG